MQFEFCATIEQAGTAVLPATPAVLKLPFVLLSRGNSEVPPVTCTQLHDPGWNRQIIDSIPPHQNGNLPA